mgnify:FL=1
MTIPKFKIYENIKSGYLTNHYVSIPLLLRIKIG